MEYPESFIYIYFQLVIIIQEYLHKKRNIFLTKLKYSKLLQEIYTAI